jgi:hypothetical protein
MQCLARHHQFVSDKQPRSTRVIDAFSSHRRDFIIFWFSLRLRAMHKPIFFPSWSCEQEHVYGNAEWALLECDRLQVWDHLKKPRAIETTTG